jgi:hypothetical protein
MDYETLDREQYVFNNNFNNTDIVINSDRTVSCRFDSYEKTANYQSNNERNVEYMDSSINDLSLRKISNESDNDKTNINIKIYRYKFTDEFIEELYKFSKIHQYDHRKDFKNAWKLWIDENAQLILQESTRLIDLGYDGDILNKMFTSARYYFRKKGTEKKEPRMRCTYIGIQKELLDSMDNHINSNLNAHEHSFKPSIGFMEFCNEHIELLQKEIELLIKNNIVNSDEIKKKIKKTYKNRYFMIINKKS